MGRGSHRCLVGSCEMLHPPHTRLAASKVPSHPCPRPQQGKHQPCNVCCRRLWNHPLATGIVLNVPPWFLDRGLGVGATADESVHEPRGQMLFGLMISLDHI